MDCGSYNSTTITVCSCRMCVYIHTIRAYCACNHLLNIQRRNAILKEEKCFFFISFPFDFVIVAVSLCFCFFSRFRAAAAATAAASSSFGTRSLMLCQLRTHRWMFVYFLLLLLFLFSYSVYASYVCMHVSLSGHMEFIECVSCETVPLVSIRRQAPIYNVSMYVLWALNSLRLIEQHSLLLVYIALTVALILFFFYFLYTER